MKMKEGYYFLDNPVDSKPTLVYGYHSTDRDEFVFGFNIYDGGGLVPMSDLRKDVDIHAAFVMDQDDLNKHDVKLLDWVHDDVLDCADSAEDARSRVLDAANQLLGLT